MNGNDTFLDINNAHLRVNNGNVQASTFVLDQIDFIASSNASTTVGFNNPTTAFLAASNIEVGTANLFVDTSTSNVGIGTNAPQDTLHINGGTRISGHILPTVNDTYDLGSAEYKIRHLFLGNTSLWLGDETRITFTGGKMKFRRRKKNALPRGLATIAANRGHTSEQQTTTAALAHAGVSTVEEMKLEHWIDYTKTLDETKEINDIFTEDANDYEATTASEAFKEIGDDIYSAHNVSIGKSTAPTSALDVVGTVKATAFEGDGSALTGIVAGQWTESSGDIYRSTGNVGIGVTNPESVLEVSDTLTNYKIKAVTLNGVPEGGAYYGYILLAKAATGGIDSESYAMGRILARRGSSTSGHKINYYDVVSSRGYNHYETFSVNHVGNRTGNDGFTSTVKVTYNGVVYHALRTGSTGGQPTTDLAFWGASKDAALIMVDSSMISNETSYGHIAFSAVNGNVGIGKIPDAGKKLDVNGTVKATAFEGDGSALTGITSGQWTESSGDIYRSSGNVGVGTNSPEQTLHVAGTMRIANATTNTETTDIVKIAAVNTTTTTSTPHTSWSQEQKLLAYQPSAYDYFGQQSAVSGDGNTICVGARNEDTTAGDSGAVYVYTYGSGTWTYRARLKASDAQASDVLGEAGLAISDDGRTIVVAARLEDTGGTSAGAAYVFMSSNSTWTSFTQQKLQASNKAADDQFCRCDVSGDGNTIIVGAPHEDGPTNSVASSGAAYIYSRSGDSWSEDQILYPSDPVVNNYFGVDNALNEDGTVAAIAATGDDTSATDSGAVYIFTKSNGTWSQETKLKITNGGPNASDHWGGVSLSDDGLTLSAGTSNDDTTASNSGAVYVFNKSNGTWSQTVKLKASNAGADDKLGGRTRISGTGDTIVSGAREEDTGVSQAGSAYIFTLNNGTWTQRQQIQASDRASWDLFGDSVGISKDGTVICVGAVLEDGGGGDSGSVYAFRGSGGGTTTTTTTIDSRLKVNDTIVATAFEGDGSALTGITSGQWTESGGNIYRSSGNVGIGTTSASTDLQIGNTSTKTSDTYLTIASDGGNAYAQGIRLIHHGTDDSNMYGWRIRGDDTDDCFHINRINAGSQVASAFTIKSGGSVLFGDVGGYGSAAQDAQVTIGGTHNSSTYYNTSNQVKLLITGGDNDSYSPYYIKCEDENGKDQFYIKGATSDGGTSGIVYTKGRIGVNTTSPHVPIHVVGGFGSLSSAYCIYAKGNDAYSSRQFHLQTNMGWNNLSIYASDDIVTGQYLVSHLGTLSSSDERIKENIVDVDDASALELFRLLKPKKYQYIDKIKRGDDTVFGFIAQDVEKTMPHGTRKIEETIPNIMEIGTVTETNIITLPNFNTSDLQSNIHTLELHDKEAKPILVTIEEVIDEHSVRVDKDLSEFLYEYDENGNDITESVTITESEYNALEDVSGYIYNENAKTYTKILTNKIYVYGERIDNFLKLNKDTIWTVSTAALQEVDRQQQADKARITELESQLTAVLARLDALENA